MTLSPEAEAIRQVYIDERIPEWHTLTLGEARPMYERRAGLIPKSPSALSGIEDARVPVSPPVRVRVYRPSMAPELPVTVYAHGGGWTLGSLDTHDGACRELAQSAMTIVVSVDYRLAPENPYPAALDDVLAVISWVRAGGVSGADPRRVAVAGDSAGGNLATAACLRLRDDGQPSPTAQVLIYPSVSLDFSTSSYLANGTGFGLTADDMVWFWANYQGAVSVDPYFAPATAPYLGDLPPAHVLTAEFDPLRDEGEEYASRLSASGVEVTLKRYQGLMHGFFLQSSVLRQGREAVNEVSAMLMHRFGGPSPVAPARVEPPT